MKQQAAVQWHKQWYVRIVGALLSLLLAYYLITMAIDTARLWAYAGMLVCVIASIRLIYLAAKKR